MRPQDTELASGTGNLDGHEVMPKEYAYFDERCSHWAKVLGLGDWVIDTGLRKLDCPAAVELRQDSHLATIHLNEVQEHQPSEAYLNRVALHECLHVVLCDLVTLTKARTVLADDIEWVQHAIIRRLENALL